MHLITLPSCTQSLTTVEVGITLNTLPGLTTIDSSAFPVSYSNTFGFTQPA